MAQRWQSDCNNSDITTDKANFILQQAKERLACTFSYSDALDKKTIVLLTAFITLVTGLFGFLTTRYVPKSPFVCQDWFSIIPILILAITFSIATWELLGNFQPLHYKPEGNSPENTAQDRLTKLSEALMIFCVAESYQESIDVNNAANEIKANRLTNCLKAVLNGFMVTAIVLIVMICLYSSAGTYQCPR